MSVPRLALGERRPLAVVRAPMIEWSVNTPGEVAVARLGALASMYSSFKPSW